MWQFALVHKNINAACSGTRAMRADATGRPARVRNGAQIVAGLSPNRVHRSTPFSPPPNPTRETVASRIRSIHVVTVGVVAATAIALLVYFLVR